jgi:hypothetical protein
MLSSLLSKFNLKYEDLTPVERDTLNQWMQSLSHKQLTVPIVTEYVRKLIEAVERELATYNLSKEQDLFLKARLKNFLMLHDFLTAPDKAQKHIEQSLQNIKPNK